MSKLIYSMLMSLDGYVEDAEGDFGWAAPDDEVHRYANEAAASIGTYLYGRRMYETMLYWEDAHTIPDQRQVALDWARQWQAAEKIVYSTTLAAPSSARTRIEGAFDPDALRKLKDEAARHVSVSGPGLAAHALRAGLVDEIEMIIFPVVVGGGKPFLPVGLRLALELIEVRRFDSGVVALRYAVRG